VEFNNALEHIYLVENSDRLVRIQQTEIKDCRAIWVSHIDQVPKGNLLVIANEFFDALPIKQFIKVKGEYYEVWIDNLEKKKD
jgi:NADH dehydrogenase [ubiquinone] 1 alpha subcomplex assembly factor 7